MGDLASDSQCIFGSSFRYVVVNFTRAFVMSLMNQLAAGRVVPRARSIRHRSYHDTRARENTNDNAARDPVSA
jgi:hypothetical protein